MLVTSAVDEYTTDPFGAVWTVASPRSERKGADYRQLDADEKVAARPMWHRTK